jgi:hypothetical protein
LVMDLETVKDLQMELALVTQKASERAMVRA